MADTAEERHILEVRRRQRAGWEARWAKPEFNPIWNQPELPLPITAALEEGFWSLGSLLDVGCGSGFIAAELAQRGYGVLGIDWSSSAVSRARQRAEERALRAPTGDTPGLSFVSADITSPVWMPPQPFDGLLDRGCLQGLSPELFEAYARGVSRCAKPGARFLLIVRDLHETFACTSERVRALFEPTFELLEERPVSMFGPSFPMDPGRGYRFARRASS
jgi:SAM-dependent methyltransferase